MSDVKVVLNSSGVSELLKSPEIQAVLKEHADRIAQSCSGAYETDVYVGKTRANASIITRDGATYRHNLKTNELLKAIS